MKKIIWIIVIIVIVAVFISLVPKTEKKTSVTTEPIKIGALLPLSGKLANLGEDIRNSMDLARAQILEKEGVDIQVVYEDSAADAKIALSAAQKMVTADELDIIVAGPGSSSNLAVAPYAEENKIMFIALSATPKLNTTGDHTFKLIPDINEETLMAARKMYAEGYRTVSFVYDSSADSNVVGKDVFVEEFKKLGGKDVFVQGYDVRTTNDYRTIFSKVKGEKPDVVYFLGTDVSASVAIPQARQLGITQKIFGWSATDNVEFIKNAGVAAEGFIFSTFAFSCEGTEEMKSFCTAYEAKFNGRKPIHYGAHAYDLITILRDVVKVNKDRAQLKDEFRQALTSKSYKGLTGELNFDKDGNIVNKDFIFRVVKDGKFVEYK